MRGRSDTDELSLPGDVEPVYHLFADDMHGLKRGSPTDVPQISTLADCNTTLPGVLLSISPAKR